MPTPTSTQALPEQLSAEWLYDFLMGLIEPDLTSENIGSLDTNYAGESSAQKNERESRYAKAFETYNGALAELDLLFTQDAQEVKNEMDAFTRHMEHTETASALQSAEQELDSSDTHK